VQSGDLVPQRRGCGKLGEGWRSGLHVHRDEDATSLVREDVQE
jgi:hypothetical protein